jgi:uncharacterized protein (DUF1501 family)
MWNRREFLKGVTVAGGSIGFGSVVPPLLQCASARAATAGRGADGILVVIFLKGGNDGLNTVVPMRDPLYRKHRRSCFISAERCLRLDDEMGLHPGLRGISDMWDDGRLAIVHGVGYPQHNRSHFVSTAVWHAARLDAAPHTATGWLGRALDQIQPATEQPLAFSVGLPETPEPLRGRHTRTMVPPEVNPSSAAPLARLLRTKSPVARDDETWRLVEQIRRDAAISLERHARQAATPGTDFPATELGGQLEQVSRLIGDKNAARVYYLQHDGYDTHAAQISPHAALLAELGNALRAFVDRLSVDGHLARTTVLVFSEFGRRVADNASGGTDHGAAGPVLVLGGGVAGGCYGQRPNLEQLDEGDVAVTTDFRSVYATLVRGVLGLDDRSVLAAEFPTIPLLRLASL